MNFNTNTYVLVISMIIIIIINIYYKIKLITSNITEYKYVKT